MLAHSISNKKGPQKTKSQLEDQKISIKIFGREEESSTAR